MKKLNKLTAVLLSLALCLGMVAPAFAASLDDLQDAINGGSGDTAQNAIGDTGYYGYGESAEKNDDNQGWDIWAKTDGDTRDVQLKGDVGPAPEPAPAPDAEPAEKPESDTITVDKTVNLDLNDHNITGNGEDTVIEVKENGDLTITGGEGETGNTISNNPSNAETPAEGANGIDVEGKLELDGVTITDTDTAVNVEAGGTAQIEDSTITGNNTGVAFVDDSSVTFVEDQNVVNGNTTNISGTGKVDFKLKDKNGNDVTYKVDAKTAEKLLKPGSIAANGTDWILAKNDGEETYTVIYIHSSKETYITDGRIRTAISEASSAVNCDVSAITGFVIPVEINTISAYAFKDCTHLKNITMHGVTTIGYGAFQGCKALETIDVSQATSISQYAFAYCEALKTVKLPQSTKKIEQYTFIGCKNLNLDFSQFESLEEIGYMAFQGCSGLSGTIKFPETLKSIASDAFRGCTSLTGLDLSDSQVTVLNQMVFQSCSNLATIKLPKCLTSIGNYAFQNCTGLTGEIEIPANVTEISQYAFSKCGGITGVKFAEGSKLTTIGFNAFFLCTGIESITLPEGLETIDVGGVFGPTTIIFPSTLTDVKPAAFHTKNTRSAILYVTKSMNKEKIATAVAAMENALKEIANVYVVNSDESLAFYRGNVSADFGHNAADEDVKLEDGSVKLTNASGTITVGENEVSLPDVAGVSVSIDTNGNITVNAPITVGGVSCPYGATIAPDGTVTALPAPPVYDYTDPTEVEVDDPAVPLAAGPVTRAQFVDYLWRHEGSPEGADCTFADVPADHEYVLALGWAQANGIAMADADGNFQPDELVTVADVRAILGNFARVFGTNAVAVADLTTLTGDDGEAVLNCDQVLAEFFGEEYILPEELDSLESDDAA